MEVEVEDFRHQMGWLVLTREVVHLDTDLIRWEEASPDPLVVLSFDDRYADTRTTAYPMLEKRRLPLTMNLMTRPIETVEPLGLRVEQSPYVGSCA